MTPDRIVEAAFAVLSVGHGFEWGWIDDMGDRDDPDAYVQIWKCSATGDRNQACLGCNTWADFAINFDWFPKKPVFA